MSKDLTEEEKKRQAARRAAFESLGRGETPDGTPIDFMEIANANLLRRQERARESWRRGPPEDLMTRRYR